MKHLLLFAFSLLTLTGLTAQNNARITGNLQSNGNFFIRDSAIGAAGFPQYDRQKFGAETEAAVRIYVAGLRSWMRGNIAWAYETPRYKGCLSMRGCSPDV